MTKLCWRIQSQKFTRKKTISSPLVQYSFILKFIISFKFDPQFWDSSIHFGAIDVCNASNSLFSLGSNSLHMRRLHWYDEPTKVPREWMCKAVTPQATQLRTYPINIWQYSVLQILILQKLWKHRICLLPLCNPWFSQSFLRSQKKIG